MVWLPNPNAYNNTVTAFRLKLERPFPWTPPLNPNSISPATFLFTDMTFMELKGLSTYSPQPSSVSCFTVGSDLEPPTQTLFQCPHGSLPLVCLPECRHDCCSVHLYTQEWHCIGHRGGAWTWWLECRHASLWGPSQRARLNRDTKIRGLGCRERAGQQWLPLHVTSCQYKTPTQYEKNF